MQKKLEVTWGPGRCITVSKEQPLESKE